MLRKMVRIQGLVQGWPNLVRLDLGMAQIEALDFAEPRPCASCVHAEPRWPAGLLRSNDGTGEILPLGTDTAEPDATPRKLRTPFRILPSRGRDLAPACLLLGGCAAAVIFGLAIVGGVPSRNAGIGSLVLLGGILGVSIGAYWLRREMRYFNPQAEYWIEIAVDHFGLMTPDATDHCPWSEIRAFEVEEKIRRNRYGARIGASYKAVARYRRYDLNIALGDFATRLGQEEKDRAEAVCATFNQLRTLALASGGKDFDAALPAGMVATEEKPATAKPRLPIRPVVMRR